MHSEMKINVLLGRSKTQRIIYINELHSSLSPNVCKALPGFYAFTRCDYNPSYFRKAKARPFQILSSSTELLDAFSKLSNQSCNVSEILPVIEKFVLGKLWEKIDSTSLPPCENFRRYRYNSF